MTVITGALLRAASDLRTLNTLLCAALKTPFKGPCQRKAAYAVRRPSLGTFFYRRSCKPPITPKRGVTAAESSVTLGKQYGFRPRHCRRVCRAGDISRRIRKRVQHSREGSLSEPC